ncbi:MAG: hypothetical protein KAY24_00835, partial [Candidatus Eisenbacteria sp.]|nr:hypothetical protein [Candidatus Eisenbacteria bacterium]
MADQQEKACRGHDELAALLARYECGALSDKERLAFEAHLLECDECFAELERSADVAAAMRDHAPALLQVLAEREAEEGARQRHSPASLASRVERFGERLHRLCLPLASPQVVVPVLIGLLVIAVGVREFSRPPGLARLATFPHERAAT